MATHEGPVTLELLGDQDFQPPRARTAGAGTAGLHELTDLERTDRLRRMREGTLGSIHSWELVTAVDGPGTRMTIFLNGCPLRCLYCHNPDTFNMRDGHPIDSDELLGRIKRYRRIFRTTGGGITLSGGESLMQPAFTARILRGAQEMGIHTALDTSGFLGAMATDQMIDDTNLVLLDVKSGIPETYRRVTGRDLQPTIDFGDRLAEHGTEVWIRFVLVPGLTDSLDTIDRVGRIVEKWPNVSRLEVLPFHQMATDKWKSLGLDYTLENVKPPSVEHTDEVRERLRRFDIAAVM